MLVISGAFAGLIAGVYALAAHVVYGLSLESGRYLLTTVLLS